MVMKSVRTFLILLPIVLNVEGDVYMHNPRGSNNRLNGQNRERQNNNRLFDSQNNDRGGYNVGDTGNVEGKGSLTYIGGSFLNIQWTNQHECGGPNAGCDIILQYMCDGNIRDGTTTQKPDQNNDIVQRGRQESQDYYKDCRARERNHGLYHADQRLNGASARFTRQNSNGARSGLECPEERDYYPYHHPTPWKDIAILTNNVQRCELYRNQSQNVQVKGYCKFDNPRVRDAAAQRDNGNNNRNRRLLAPITKKDCDNRQGMTWVDVPAWGLAAPQCLQAPKTRDNHNGNTEPTGNPNSEDQIPRATSYKWKLPDIDEEACVLRIRYNISIGDYEQFAVDVNNDKPRSTECLPTIDIGKSYGLGLKEAQDRGYEIQNNPKIKPLKDVGQLEFQLALNTAQTGRTFQDRSHRFRITRKKNVPGCPLNAPVENLNVIGKRGNIVQVYPAVEYGFEPAILKVNTGTCIHAQWTGSLRNPPNNDGEGRQKEDKSNMVSLTGRTFKTNQSPQNTLGHSANSYPLKINSERFLDADKATAVKFAFPRPSESVALPVGRLQIDVVRAVASSTFQGRTNIYGPQMAINGRTSTTNRGFFMSNWQYNPWLMAEIKPTLLSGVTVVNRRDRDGARFRNVEVRAGNNPNPTGNPIVGRFQGPGYTRGKHEIVFNQPVTAKYVTIQMKGRSRQQLAINGLLFNAAVGNADLGCVPKEGPKAGLPCIFPFTDGGKTCPGPKCCNLDNDAKGNWCSTKVDTKGTHVPGNFAYCKGSQCDAACVLKAGGKAGLPCIFPSKYNGKTCPGPKCCNLDNDPGGSWCSTKVDAQGNHVSGNWGYCKGSSCDGDTSQRDATDISNDVTVNDVTRDHPLKLDEKTQKIKDVAEEVENALNLVDEKMAEILDRFDDEVVSEIEKRAQNGDAAKLDYAPAYVNIPPIQVKKCETYNYLCTRNNNFSNRSQKGKIIVTGC